MPVVASQNFQSRGEPKEENTPSCKAYSMQIRQQSSPLLALRGVSALSYVRISAIVVSSFFCYVEERAVKVRGGGPIGASTAWKNKHAEVRKKEKCEGIPCWAGTDTLQWPGLETQRVKDVINLAWQVNVKKLGADLINPFKLYVDVSQSGHHRPWVYGKLRSVTTSSVIFNFGARRCLLPEEVFAILGFDEAKFGTLSSFAKKDLVGECMALPCVAMCLAALCSVLPYKS
eukprot:6490349-Amphidinium_carterae.2